MGITKAYCPEFSGLNLIPPIALYELSQPREARITVTPRISKIKYRYQSEIEQEIKGDDYEITNNNNSGSCPDEYHAFGTYLQRNSARCSQLGYWRTINRVIGTEVISYQPVVIDNYWVIRLTENRLQRIRPINELLYNERRLSDGGLPLVYRDKGLACLNINRPALGDDVEVTDIVRINGLPDNCGTCNFKIYKCGQLLYEEQRENCPQVEIDNCILDYQNQEIIDINLAPFEFLYVANGITNILDIFNLFNLINSTLNVIPLPNSFNNYLQNLLGGNEEECIIIFTYIPGSSINIIKQICSSCNCPSPQYTVECDPTEQCPDNTECEIECDDYICCYDKKGYILKTIYK